MLNRGTMMVAMLAAAGGLPYVFSSGGARGPAAEKADDTHAAASSTDHHTTLRPDDPKALILHAGKDQRPIEGLPVQDLNEILSFNVTPQQILDRWPRVSAALSELDLHGYRVVLVTGTGASDLAGSLTYYYTPQQKLQRITFIGATGDPGKLINHLASKHQFVRVKHPDPSVTIYQVQFSGTLLSELKIRPARILRAGDALSRFEVALTMEHPPTDGTFMDLIAGKPSQSQSTTPRFHTGQPAARGMGQHGPAVGH